MQGERPLRRALTAFNVKRPILSAASVYGKRGSALRGNSYSAGHLERPENRTGPAGRKVKNDDSFQASPERSLREVRMGHVYSTETKWWY